MFGKYLNGQKSSGDNLRGFEIDIEAFLDESDVLSDAWVTSGEDEDCMITATCNYSDISSEKEIASELEEIWLEYLRYSEFEKHAFEISSGKVTLYFCTKSGPLGVSGKIVASLK